MKFNKQIAIILVLLSMLLSAIAVSIYFYNKNQQVVASQKQLVTIFVAKENIKKDTLITAKHIKETTLAKQYILTKPLTKKEILNKYAKESIYKNEAFLKEKLDVKIKKVEKKKTLDYEFSSYNMAFSLFKNPNYSLEPNQIIKIISVYPDQTENEYSVQYVAKDIKVLGFLNGGKPTEKTIIKKKIKKIVKKKQVEQIIEIRSQELILDIKEDVLLSLIDDYNKGKQLWMVKTRATKVKEAIIKENKITEEDSKKKIEELFKEKDSKKKTTKKRVLKRKYTPRSYPIKWYQTKESYNTEVATITYSNNSDLKDTKKAKISLNHTNECSKKDNLLITISKKVYIRKHPSIRAKIHRKIYRNYVIPFTSISKINTSWYRLCDGNYIQRKDIREISYDEYKKLRK